MATQDTVPLISVVLPIEQGSATVDCTVRSLREQTFRAWELLAVDFGSTDGRNESIQAWARQDPRIRVGRITENRCPATARNAALRRARGQIVAYMDPGDEYVPDYLERLSEDHGSADVLLSSFDLVYDDGLARGRPTDWDPGLVVGCLFAENIVAPLAVAHRRMLWEQVGGFNELLCRGEDWDLWKRFARAGARFAVLPHKCGRHATHADQLKRARTPTPLQFEAITANWEAGKPLFYEASRSAPRRSVKRIAYLSPHCLVDSTNGAATATVDQLRFLQHLGFQCQALCGSRLDRSEDVPLEQVLMDQGISYEMRMATFGSHQESVIATKCRTVPVNILRKASTDAEWTDAEAEAFLGACADFLKHGRPDAVLTYGGDAVSEALAKLIKAHDVPLVFGLHNFGYVDPRTFRPVDYVIVPTEFCRQYYWHTLGLACQHLPLVIDRERVLAPARKPQYLTFVNPEPRKGVFLFARIAEVLAKRRPDIPILVVEGKERVESLPKIGLDLSGLGNITVMPNTPDPRQFFGVTKVLLMPSTSENFGFVAGEAMLNGIPVVAGNRGGLPETIGDAGFLLEIPAQYTPETRIVPSVEEVEPWVETIVRLWDDQSHYDRFSQAAKQRADFWQPDRLAPIYLDFFGSLCPQPGPPLVPITQASAAKFVTCTMLGQAGRLGNQLFQIAVTIGTAHRNGMEFVFPPWAYADHFQRPIPQSQRIPVVDRHVERSFAYNDLKLSDSADLVGCFQSERYFQHCEEEIRSYLTPQPQLMQHLTARFGEILESNKTCSIHVRRGHYVGNPYYVDLAATDYYGEAVRRFDADTVFLIFSDDISWCRERFHDSRFVFVPEQADIADLFLMSLCRGHIIANSSFSWWGAWLDPRRDKTVVAPSHWFAGSYADPSLPFHAMPYEGYHDASDIIPEGWIRL